MSKKYFSVALALTLLLGAFLNISAQEDTFEVEDLETLKQAAYEKLSGKTYRTTTIVTSYSNGNSTPTVTTKRIFEKISPDRQRFVAVVEKADGVKRYEAIHIGERRFYKTDDGEWIESTMVGNGSGNGSGSGSSDGKLEETIERKLKKGAVVDNKTVDLYETVRTTKYIYPAKTYTKIWKQSYSFDAAGMFVKFEEEVENDADNSISRTITEYEYNPKDIKIEMPILKKKSKSQ